MIEFAGVVPGVHPNLFAYITLAYFYGFDPLILAVFLLSSGIANSFVSFLPSIYLGAPESESSLSVLPGHRMLLRGRAHEAVKLTVEGGIYGVLISLCFLPLLFATLKFYDIVKRLIPIALVLVCLYMILTESNTFRKIAAIFVLVFSGIMGFAFLQYDTLFPVFTGFFGMPLLFLSWIRSTKMVVSQSLEEEYVNSKHSLWGGVIGSIAGILSGFLPGVGAAQTSAIVQELMRKKSDKIFLASLGAITTVDVLFSVLAIYLIGNPRSGIAQAIMQTMGVFSIHMLVLLVVCSMFAMLASSYITLKLSRAFAIKIAELDYRLLSRNVFLFLWLLVFLFSGFHGIVLCACAFFLGLFVNLSGIKRTTLMGFLILPTISFYLKFL
jgi:putative membrane protein